MTSSLQTTIDALNAELRRTSVLDAQARSSLASLQQEIDRVLHAQGDVALSDRLEKMAVRFETDHPAVGNALRQAIDALAKAGM